MPLGPTYSIKISTWNSPRAVAKNGSRVYLQVATCYPCSVCLARESEIESKIVNGVLYEKHVIERILWISFPLPSDEKGEEVESLVRCVKRSVNIPITILSTTPTQPIIISSSLDSKTESKSIREIVEIVEKKIASLNLKFSRPIIVASIAVSFRQDPEQAVKNLLDFSKQYPPESISKFGNTGMGGAVARVAESILKGDGGTEVQLFAVWNSPSNGMDLPLSAQSIFINCHLIKGAFKEMSSDIKFKNLL
jgi:hypothetical protein